MIVTAQFWGFGVDVPKTCDRWLLPAQPAGRCLVGVAVILFAALGGCATLERLPAVTYAQAKQTEILDIPDARFYVSESKQILDVAVKAAQRRNMTRGVNTTRNFLAISGGGDDGAFGAGLLVGWSDRGDRPEFDIVTGVSTGSLSAPFAFLGRAHDPQLRSGLHRDECEVTSSKRTCCLGLSPAMRSPTMRPCGR